MATLTAFTDLFRLLADPTRVRLLALLEQEQLTVAELTRVTQLSQSRISTHLGKLREAGLVRDRRDGAASYYRLAREGMPEEASALWQLARANTRDALLDQDARRLKSGAEARTGRRTWADSVAGRMARHYSPGRTWESLARALLGVMELGDVLDVASGDCAVAELISPRARSVACLDRSNTVLAAGRNRLGDCSNLSFERGDMHALPFADSSFDHVLLLNCLTYAEDPQAIVNEAARVLRPGGTVAANTLFSHRHQEKVAAFQHVRLGFKPRSLRDWFEGAGLSVALCEVTSRERRAPHFEVIGVHASKRRKR